MKYLRFSFVRALIANVLWLVLVMTTVHGGFVWEVNQIFPIPSEQWLLGIFGGSIFYAGLIGIGLWYDLKQMA
jgi:hypothetical protein